MSTTYSIACKDCKKSLWIAQSSQGHGHVYSGVPNIMKALYDFLSSHRGHHLIYDVDCEEPICSYDEIQPPADSSNAGTERREQSR